MDKSDPRGTALEQSEAKGTIELATLRRVAAALDCRMVYALVANQPLELTVRERARLLAKKRPAPVEHTMLREDQSVVGRDPEARLDELIRETNPRLFLGLTGGRRFRTAGRCLHTALA